MARHLRRLDKRHHFPVIQTMKAGEVFSASELDMCILALCAVRLDPNTSPERFTELIDKVVEAAKQEEAHDANRY